MPRALGSQLRAALVPFHWPGRDARFVGSLQPGMARHYNLLWLTRWRSSLWAATLCVTMLAAAAAVGQPGGPWRPIGVATLVALAPAWLLFNHFESRLRRRLIERDHPHLCRTCGYDLRGTPDRCPECGASRA